MHSATPLAVHRWRLAGLARAGLGTAAPAGQHRPGVARMMASHLFDLRLNGTIAGAGSATIVIAAVRASASAGGAAPALSAAVSPWACVTLPTIAWPPSLTDTCCTVTFCSPPVR